MTTVWYCAVEEDPKPFTLPNACLFKSKEAADKWANSVWPKDLKSFSFEINDKCNCDNLMQTAQIVMKVENNEFVGSSNFMILHEELGLPFYIDVEEFTKGKYIMMSLPYFNKHYKIINI